MKIVAYLLLLVGPAFLANAEPQKHALIIAIGNYNKPTKWASISSIKDLRLVRNALVQYLQFPASNIDSIVNESATRTGIRKALVSLAERVKPGDMVIIVYAGHGVQISDDNAEESDGLDEALVPWDAPMKSALAFNKYKYFKNGKEPYDGSLHMRDDEFGALINLIRSKVGSAGHVVVILDSCHSGTATRGGGTGKVRGATDPLILPNAKKAAPKDGGEDVGFGLMTEKTDADPKTLGKYVLFSGASADQANYEYGEEEVGSLSYALVKSLSQIKAGETYSSLFNSIRVTMASILQREQTPTLEGDVNLELFKGVYRVPETYFDILGVVQQNELYRIMKDSVQNLRINVGSMGGVFPGSRICLMEAHELKADPSKALASGTVTHAGDFASEVRLDKYIYLANKTAAHAFVTSYAMSSKRITVSLQKIADVALKAELQNELTKVGLIELTDDRPQLEVQLKPGIGGKVPVKKLTIYTPVYGSTLHEIPMDSKSEAINNCKTLLMNFARGQLIRELNLSDDQIKVTIDLLPYDSATNSVLDKAPFMKGNSLEIAPGKKRLQIEIYNHGTEPAYYNILDIQPDGKISVIIPRKSDSEDPSGWKLQPGKGPPIIINISPPYGTEVFKVIASRQPIDLRKILANPMATSRGSTDAFEKLFKDSFQETFSRGDSAVPEEVNTFEVSFTIVRKKPK